MGIARKELRRRIKAIKQTWFTRANAALTALPAVPRSSDFPRLWSEIKDVYIDLQHSKCGFCEKPLEGRIEQDVEHFRPKAGVDPWEPPPDLVAAGLPLSQPADGGKEPGYAFLAFDPLNYVAACKNCNTIFKGNLFPIAGARKSRAKKPPANVHELPYLIYPIGDRDKPEDLISFYGAVPRPAVASGHDRFRALVTIAVFKLDDPVERRVFYEGRARQIQLLFLNLTTLDDSADAVLVAAAAANVNRMLQDREPFANCLRCFHRLYQRSRAEATQIYTDLTTLLDTISP
ncbi:hypothetical protein [Fimbriiglobus ruber]|uniref:hypothetical protein n=1 Tax=Fimbriiglobus ruber TaxID=1908690 RepID=UPI00117A2729|nr:hypothetical protein [Fimbriiglobus ruber]